MFRQIPNFVSYLPKKTQKKQKTNIANIRHYSLLMLKKWKTAINNGKHIADL